MNTASKRLGRIVQNGLLIIYAIFALFPLIWMLILSIKSDAEMYTTTFIFSPTLDNYKAVLLESDYLQYMLDSLIVAGGAVIVSVVAGVPAAYALARYNFKKKEDIAFQILSFKFAPEILVVLPLFMIYQMLGIYDSYFGLIWVYQLISMPLLIWVVRGYFEDISVDRGAAGLYLRVELLHIPADAGWNKCTADHCCYYKVPWNRQCPLRTACGCGNDFGSAGDYIRPLYTETSCTRPELRCSQGIGVRIWQEYNWKMLRNGLGK